MSSAPPKNEYAGKPVKFPIRFIKMAKNVTTTCDYQMGSQSGKFTTPDFVVFEFTDQQQTLKLDCSADDVIKAPRNIWGIKGYRHVGSWTSEHDTTFSTNISWGTTGLTGPRHRVRVLRPTQKLRAKLIESTGVQILTDTIVVVPKKNSTKRTRVR